MVDGSWCQYNKSKIHTVLQRLIVFIYNFIGLVLEINVEQNEYIGDLTKDAGVRVQIENAGKSSIPLRKRIQRGSWVGNLCWIEKGNGIGSFEKKN